MWMDWASNSIDLLQGRLKHSICSKIIMIHEVETFDVSKSGDPRTEEYNCCNHHSFLRWKHFKPEEWVRLRIGREETKYFLEIRVERMAFRERVKVVERSFLWKLTYCLHIKWLVTALSATLMRKWLLNSWFTTK